MQFSIYRFDPAKDKAPYMQDYDLDIEKHSCVMLLDALLAIRDHMDDSLMLRRSCREGVCGSDGMNINGKNGLACITALSSLKSPVVVRPLPGLPVVRDLVVDMTQFYAQYEKVTAKDLMTVAQKYFTPNTLTVGTIGQGEKGGVK